MSETAPEGPRNPEAAPQPSLRREPVFNLPAIVLAFMAICFAIHLICYLALGPDPRNWGWVLWRGAFIPQRYAGQLPIDIYFFTTPVTYSLLHADWLHLAVNMIWLGAFGSPLANRLGAGRFVLFWGAASLAAVGLYYVLHMSSLSPLVGASGAISGMMGSAARFGFRIDRSSGKAAFGGPVLPISLVLRSRGVLVFLVVWMATNLVTGFYGENLGIGGQIAWEAHIGGFLVGFLGISHFVPAGWAVRRA